MNKKKQPEIHSMNDSTWDALAAMWQEQEAQETLRSIEEEPVDAAEMEAFFAEHDAQYRSQIDNYFKQKQKRHHYAVRHFSRPAQRIAACLVLFVVLGGTALAVGKTVKIYYSRLQVEDHEEYTSLDIRPQRDELDVGVEHGLPIAEAQEGELDVPEGWEGTYFPSIIPEGLVVSDISSNEVECDVAYSLPGEYVRRFAYTESTCGMNIDSENSEIETRVIYGCEATILTKQDRVTIYWYNGKTIFTVTAYGYTVDETLTYAGSLRKIKK